MPTVQKQSEYARLEQIHVEQRLLPSEVDIDDLDRPIRRPLLSSRFPPLLCFAASTTLFALSLGLVFYSHGLLKRANEQCFSKWNIPSPLNDAVGDPINLRFDGRFWLENKFKGPPSPERDAAWEDITDGVDGGITTISKETLMAIGASEHSVELPDGRYPAAFEIVHQLHCLNFIRMASYEDHYKDWALPWHDKPETVRVHLDHCIDILRQKLMCDSDTGLNTYVWVKGRTKPFPDFSVQKKCRNHTRIQQWIRSHYTEIHNVSRLTGAYEYEEDI